MHPARRPRTLALTLVALVSLACGPKNPGDTEDPPAGTSTSGTTGDATTVTATTIAQECMPGEMKSGEGDCLTCTCSDAGLWECDRCSPTSGPLETTTTDATETTDAPVTTTTDPTTTSGTSSETTDGGLFQDCGALGEGDMFEITKAAVVSDELALEVAYGGGCETHDFTLCFAGVVLDTNIVLVDVVHDAHADACDAFITEPRSFDLTPFQVFGPSPIQLSLDGWDDLLEYSF
jgi:hypothetical protein